MQDTTTYAELAKTEAYRRDMAAIAENYPQIELALETVERLSSPVSDLSFMSPDSVALRAQFDAGNRAAIARLRVLFSTMSENERKVPEELVPWGTLTRDE